MTDIGEIINERHAGPGWLARSGIACLFGQHWPAAALASAGNEHGEGSFGHSRCADCGSPMVRLSDGRWTKIEARMAGTRGRQPVAPA